MDSGFQQSDFAGFWIQLHGSIDSSVIQGSKSKEANLMVSGKTGVTKTSNAVMSNRVTE